MQSFIRLTDFNRDELLQIFKIADNIEEFSGFLSGKIPVINAMTDNNHPCEMLSDLYSLSKLRASFLDDEYLFVGPSGNIGKAWKEASEVFGFSLSQCSPDAYAVPGVRHNSSLKDAIIGK